MNNLRSLYACCCSFLLSLFSFARTHKGIAIAHRFALALIAAALAIMNFGWDARSFAGSRLWISAQPANQTVTASQSATFTVVASGRGYIGYQWYENGVAISGANSSSYTTPPTSSSDNGEQFDVVVRNRYESLTSSTATLTVNAAMVAPSIAAQPVNQSVTAGQSATFTVFANGTAPFAYQWQENGVSIGGATSSSYTTPATTTSNSGSIFKVVVTNSAGTATSNAATLTVNPAPAAPTIATQPTNQTVTAGQTATFSIVATGAAPLNYQWQKKGANISGATSASYTTPATTTSDSGSTFDVVVSNSAGTATSNAGTLTVNGTVLLTVSPTSLNFGNQTVNMTSGADVVTVMNPGSASISVSSVQASTNFAVTGFSGPVTLSSGQTLTLSVTFTPTSATTFNGTLTITTTAPSSPNTVSLSGSGIVQSGPDLTAPICGLTNDSSNHVPNVTAWKNFTPPAVGGTYVDSVYGCTIKRLTDGSAAGVAEHHYYATTEPMSAGDTKVLVFDESGSWHIIDLNGNAVVPAGNMPSANDGLFMWDRADDNAFWATSGNVVRKCTVSGSTVTCAANHTFTEYSGYMVNFMDETDMTPNGWLPMVGQNTQGGNIDVFLWNPGTSTKSPVYKTTCTADVRSKNNGCLHKLISTPNDGIIIQFSGNGSGAEQGNRLWESPWLNPLAHVENLTDHVDSGKDLLGNEVGVFEDYQDNPGPWPSCMNGWRPMVVTLPNVPTACMFDAPTNPAWHVSYRDWPTRSWAVYSAQASSAAENFNNASGYADPSTSNWSTYTNEIVLVRIDAKNDPTKIYRLGLTHSREHQGFWAEPRAAISFDGKYVIFDSNAAWEATGCGSIANCTDIYLIQIH